MSSHQLHLPNNSTKGGGTCIEKLTPSDTGLVIRICRGLESESEKGGKTWLEV